MLYAATQLIKCKQINTISKYIADFMLSSFCEGIGYTHTSNIVMHLFIWIYYIRAKPSRFQRTKAWLRQSRFFFVQDYVSICIYALLFGSAKFNVKLRKVRIKWRPRIYNSIDIYLIIFYLTYQLYVQTLLFIVWIVTCK